MKHFFTLVFLSLLLGACSKEDQIPEDANDNFITSVIVTVDGHSYTADIAENIITLTVPYTVSLNNVQVKFEYTPSATIMPDPTTITDWDTERTFRVKSYNGKANEYTYKVIKDEIRHEGDVTLKSSGEIATFVASGVTIVKGNLTIGSDEKNAEQITDISTLSLLKKVEGNIIIRSSFNGGDLTGLDNITSIGGLQIGTADAFATNVELHMVSMKSLESVTGDIVVRNNQITYIQFDKLTNIGGNAAFSSSALLSFEFPKLTTVTGDFDIQGITEDTEAGGEIVSLKVPELTTVGGKLGVNNLDKLVSMEFPKLKEAGSVNFISVPIILEKLSLPNLSVVNGNLDLISNYVGTDAFNSTGNNKLLEIDGLSNLTVVKGTLTISKFQVLSKLPNWSKLTKLGGITLSRLLEYYGQTLDLSKIDFEAFGNNEPTISITGQTCLAKLITKEDMSHVNINLATGANTGNPGPSIPLELNFKSVKDFKDNNMALEDPVYTFEKVYGNLELSRPSKKGISAPSLLSVTGYIYLTLPMFAPNVDFSKLESIGGQFYIVGTLNGTGKPIYDFSKLKSVGCATNPQYAKEGADNNNILYGSFFITTTKALTFPSLERVGGVGMTIRTAPSFSCPNLQTIDGALCASSVTASTFNMPNLTKLSGVRFYNSSKFVDYTMFGKFIKDGQITKENWNVTGTVTNGYYPTYDEMVQEHYTKP